MQMVASSDELEIFDSKNLQDLILFKWECYGRNHHLFGSFMHAVYTVIFVLYVNYIYLEMINLKYVFHWSVALFIGMLYPWLYDLAQMIRDGPKEYFADLWNWADFVYIYGSLINILIQNFVGPYEVVTEILMSVIVVLLIVKTFFFLRIRTSFTPIVIMLTNVIYDLRIFLFFYMILIFMFS